MSGVIAIADQHRHTQPSCRDHGRRIRLEQKRDDRGRRDFAQFLPEPQHASAIVADKTNRMLGRNAEPELMAHDPRIERIDR